MESAAQRERDYERSETNREEGKPFFVLKEAQRHTKPAVLISLWHSECHFRRASRLVNPLNNVLNLMTNGQLYIHICFCVTYFHWEYQSEESWSYIKWFVSRKGTCVEYLGSFWQADRNKQLQTRTEHENKYPSIASSLSVSQCFYTQKTSNAIMLTSYHDITQFAVTRIVHQLGLCDIDKKLYLNVYWDIYGTMAGLYGSQFSILKKKKVKKRKVTVRQFSEMCDMNSQLIPNKFAIARNVGKIGRNVSEEKKKYVFLQFWVYISHFWLTIVCYKVKIVRYKLAILRKSHNCKI